MLSRFLIFVMLISSLMGCTASTPTALVAETPLARTDTSVAKPISTATILPTTLSSPPTAMGEMRLTILYDNTTIKPLLRSDWGFATLVEYRDHTLLFDTGANGSILMDNLQQLNVDPKTIEAVILSHPHNDHTNGLQTLLDTGIRPTVYVPSAFPSTLKEQIGSRTRLVEVTDALTILPGVHLTRPIGSIIEQALIVETMNGTVLITGCAHPGIVNMVRQAQEVVPGKILLLVGGFHLLEITDKIQLQSIIAELRQMGVEGAMSTHCTGDLAIELFRTEYRNTYVDGGVGVVATFSVK